MDTGQELIIKMLSNYREAIKDYNENHKSKHWDIFAEDYEKLINDISLWDNFRNNGLSNGLDTSGHKVGLNKTLEATSKKDINNIKSRYDSLLGITGSDFINKYSESDIGNPAFLNINNVKINIVDLRHLYNLWQLKSLIVDNSESIKSKPFVITEIDGGYGGLVHKLKQVIPNAVVILVDLPEVNAIQTYYISKLNPGSKILLYEDVKDIDFEKIINGEYDFIIIPPWLVNKIPHDSCDLCINTRSMMEMNKNVVDNYMDVINDITKIDGVFYCVNRYSKSTVGEDIRIKDYKFKDNWYFAISQPSWDQPWIHELAAVKTKYKNANLSDDCLETLPSYRWSDFLINCKKTFKIFFDLTWGGNPNVNPGVRGSIINSRKQLLRFLSKRIRKYPNLRSFVHSFKGNT